MASDDDDFKKQLELEAQERIAAAATEGGQKDPYTYVDESDGTIYQWDHQKHAWFPKITDDFLAAYHANYGNYQPVDTGKDEDNDASKDRAVVSEDNVKDDAQKTGEKRKQNEAAWFEVDDAHNTNVYVSGLPLDTSEEEFGEIMSKCGMVMKDPTNNQMKLKMYRHADGSFKGDGLCCYIKIESVDLALSILDGYRIKDKVLHVERAKFQLKGDYDPKKKPKKKKPKEKEKLKKKMEKLFDWRPDRLRGERLKCEKTVIIKNMFEPKEFESDATLILEYQRDVRDECAKFGEVKKVVVYDRNPEGVVSVSFKEAEEADQCILVMNKRWFAGRQLTAETWDGRTRFKVEETEEELEKRLKQWDQFLEAEPSASLEATSPGITVMATAATAANNNGNSNAGDNLNTAIETVGAKTDLPSVPLALDKNGDDAIKGAELTDEEKHSGEDSDA